MKIDIIGAGPAGLHFASLMKRLNPRHEITIHERGPRSATWGFGVVFSDQALDFLRTDDNELFEYLRPHMESWSDLTINHNGTSVPIAGNGYAAIGRLQMLSLLYQHVERLGVTIRFDTEITSLAQLKGADLILAANGASSWVREENRDKFATTTDIRPNKFMWCGSTMPFDTLSLSFHETGTGVFCAHHYRYTPAMSTFLIEVTDETWKRTGFDRMSNDEAMRHCEKVFARELGGHPILSNNSYWRNFPVIWNGRWHFDNVVLMGDALRPAHFSIGSGTRMAMLDAVALCNAFRETDDDVPAALARFRELRMPVMKKIWDAANRSMRWYEEMDKLVPTQNAIEFAYDYMTRTGRISHAKVREIDPRLAAAYESQHPEVLDAPGA
ncbi:MAG: FAD-dependent monooxygenase [Burkholderiales bacterium]|uniref:FAD-dependent monooxygenase n=2 Tax=Ottowia pentelensis TaxID=511108 RepID=A0ABV6PQL4_9BURK|nr:FAD-dependent monooxygenase [Ottowia sp.]MBN9406049.1 FAD-dependent monooxygenase [Burkholderiales bacterium]MBS0404275.1 FAD-dependent monooxygenase [Pseudomonadota bacterium]MBS0413788.1 FAD-dependent monooxygenase [Pseudomonadota bacterium]HMN56390.1 FAD-dependent monooxygenase [Ottowia sp.]